VATIVKTQRAAYQVSGIKREASGRITLVATQPSGKKRYLTRPWPISTRRRPEAQ
jgi:hypothetical protein